MSKVGESLLLDTSVIIAGFKRDQQVRYVLGKAETLYVPVIAYGELYTGALKSDASEQKLEQLGEFMKATALLDIDWRTAQHYAVLRKQLELKGKPIPENDIWIAALAQQHDLKLYTQDTHFERIDTLRLVKT